MPFPMACRSDILSGMDGNLTALERAFALAESGEYPTVDSIRRKLRYEGYLDQQVTGGSLLSQLRAKIREAASAPRS